jgi:endonuclease/exonuclease/phosphatase family metal-dependent hydrolase
MMNKTSLFRRTVPSLDYPGKALLEEARTARAGRAAHDRFAASLPCLHAIEYRAVDIPRTAGSTIKVASWNAERCKYQAQSAALLARLDADIVLLSELDIGMARSGNRHTIAELAEALDTGYAFGVEYVELGLGDDREKAWHVHQSNDVGLHGNGLLSKLPLEDLFVIRLDEGARWFAGQQSTHERRIGWRMAIGARVALASTDVVVMSVHLESSTDTIDRAAQVSVMIDALDTLAGDMPVIIGGDFNTAALPAACENDTNWFANAQAYEPLFASFRAAGYDWLAANTRDATERMRPDGTPEPPFRKIDWFFTRGLAIAEAGIVAAIDDGGIAISDHEVLWLTAAAGRT